MMEEMEKTFVPQNILVTGGAGFIGSHVVRNILEKIDDARVVVLDNLSYCSSLKNLKGLDDKYRSRYKFIQGDILSADLVAYTLKNESIDCIIHFAAETHVDNSFGNSLLFTRTNVMGTHVLLEAGKQVGRQLRRFIHVSTDEVYGESTGSHFFSEEHVLEPTNPYAATKAAAELLAKAYHRSFDVPIIITRSNNIYGPGQYPEKIIPKFINQAMRGIKLTIHGTGCTTRNLVHISDVSDAFMTILLYGQPGQTLNIGGSESVSVLEVARAILDHFGKELEDSVEYVQDRPFNDTRYDIDCGKLRTLGWKPRVGFKNGLKQTIAWYLTQENYWGCFEHALAAHPCRCGDHYCRTSCCGRGETV